MWFQYIVLNCNQIESNICSFFPVCVPRLCGNFFISVLTLCVDFGFLFNFNFYREYLTIRSYNSCSSNTLQYACSTFWHAYLMPVHCAAAVFGVEFKISLQMGQSMCRCRSNMISHCNVFSVFMCFLLDATMDCRTPFTSSVTRWLSSRRPASHTTHLKHFNRDYTYRIHFDGIFPNSRHAQVYSVFLFCGILTFLDHKSLNGVFCKRSRSIYLD